LRNNGREVTGREPPPLYSKAFMEVMALAIKEGRISARRAADLLDITIDDIADLGARHSVDVAIEL
jgi:hypothetical protein